jgi:hypothetical protein
MTTRTGGLLAWRDDLDDSERHELEERRLAQLDDGVTVAKLLLQLSGGNRMIAYTMSGT